MWRVKLSLAVLVLFSVVSAVILRGGSSSAAVSKQDPLKPLSDFLRDKGWTAFYIPSGRFRAGGVITPESQDVKLDPSSCFPKLRTPAPQDAALPDIEQGRSFSAETGVAFLRGLFGTVYGSIQDAATVHLAFSDIKHLAVDIKTLSDAYSAACNQFLELIRDPVVISELLMGKPSVTFIRKDGGKVEMTAEKVKHLFTGQVRAEVEVKDSATLITKEVLYFAYKAVKPVRQANRVLFVDLSFDQLKPNYIAVWENEISKYAIAPLRPGDLLDPKNRI